MFLFISQQWDNVSKPALGFWSEGADLNPAQLRSIPTPVPTLNSAALERLLREKKEGGEFSVGVSKKEGVKKKRPWNVRASRPPCARVHSARAAHDRSGSVEAEAEVEQEAEEEAGRRCRSCGNDGAGRGEHTSLILYQVGPVRGHSSAASAMESSRGEQVSLFSSLAAAFLVL